MQNLKITPSIVLQNKETNKRWEKHIDLADKMKGSTFPPIRGNLIVKILNFRRKGGMDAVPSALGMQEVV